MEPLPKGEYKFKIVKKSFEEGKNSTYTKLTLEVLDDPDYGGKKITHNVFHSDKSVEAGIPDGMKAMLLATNIPYEVTTEGQTIFDDDDLLGCDIVCEVSQRIVQEPGKEDKVYNDVEAIYPPY
jgi:hypothetical protein